jgi:hypothetical protein
VVAVSFGSKNVPMIEAAAGCFWTPVATAAGAGAACRVAATGPKSAGIAANRSPSTLSEAGRTSGGNRAATFVLTDPELLQRAGTLGALVRDGALRQPGQGPPALSPAEAGGAGLTVGLEFSVHRLSGIMGLIKSETQPEDFRFHFRSPSRRFFENRRC